MDVHGNLVTKYYIVNQSSVAGYLTKKVYEADVSFVLFAQELKEEYGIQSDDIAYTKAGELLAKKTELTEGHIYKKELDDGYHSFLKNSEIKSLYDKFMDGKKEFLNKTVVRDVLAEYMPKGSVFSLKTVPGFDVVIASFETSDVDVFDELDRTEYIEITKETFDKLKSVQIDF